LDEFNIGSFSSYSSKLQNENPHLGDEMVDYEMVDEMRW